MMFPAYLTERKRSQFNDLNVFSIVNRHDNSICLRNELQL